MELRRLPLYLVAGLVTAALGESAAAVTYLSQSRTISASLSSASGSTQSSAAAPGFGLWDETVTAPPVPPPAFGGLSMARQVSRLAPLLIDIDSSFDAQKPTFVGTGFASASSSLTVSFSLTRATTYRLHGVMKPPPDYFAPYVAPTRLIRFTGPGTNFELTGSWNGSTPPTLTGTGAFDQSGSLVPGSYTLTTTGVCNDGGIVSGGLEFIDRFNATLDLAPPRGDFDFDGEVRASDIDRLMNTVPGPVSPLTAFLDLNGDGQIVTAPNTPASDADAWVRDVYPTAYGDADLDSRVQFDDLLFLAQHYGGAGGWAQGNFDNRSGVDFDDLLLLAQNYGFGSGARAGDFAADWALARSMVPEPTTVGSLSVAGLLLSRMCRRAVQA